MTQNDAPRGALSRRAALALGAGLPLIVRGAAAQDLPARPMRIIVPYTPGGTTDIATRLVGFEPLSRVIGQPVVVENRPGANSIVGATAAATAAPDGTTLVMVLPAHAANATLQAGKMPFDAITSFAPVSLVVQAPLVLAGSKHIPAEDFRGFIDYIRAHPGRVNYGCEAASAPPRISPWSRCACASADHGARALSRAQPALQDLMAGNVGLMFDTYSTLKPQFEAGDVHSPSASPR